MIFVGYQGLKRSTCPTCPRKLFSGDRIKLVLNKATIHPNITLRNSGYTIDIKLKEGLNTVEFYALNEGTSGPNTAELKVVDEGGSVISSGQWLLTTGYKARLIVLKQ